MDGQTGTGFFTAREKFPEDHLLFFKKKVPDNRTTSACSPVGREIL
jgi:hypothetical protein